MSENNLAEMAHTLVEQKARLREKCLRIASDVDEALETFSNINNDERALRIQLTVSKKVIDVLEQALQEAASDEKRL